MSRVTARAGIAGYFTNAAIQHVGTVYSARPVILEETAYTQTMLGEAITQTDAGSSAVLVVNLPRTRRERKADTGRGAVNDVEIHEAATEVFFASTGGDGLLAQADYDQIIDSMIALIRNDPTMGGTLWSAGEYTGVEHTMNEPYTDADGLTIFIVGTVRFEAYIWRAGNNPQAP